MQTEFSTTVATCAGDLEMWGSAASDVGAVRAVNEDSFFARPPVFLVADGMGGHSFGDRASQTVAATFDEHFPGTAPTDPATVIAAVDEANQRIQRLVAEVEGPGAVAGTTVTGIALVEVDPNGEDALAPHWMIFNVGDSRVYGWNGRDVVQITVDHSAVQELVYLGVLTPEEALIHPDRNVITRAVGSEPEVLTDLWLMPVQGHQVFIVCSDGLTKELDDHEIAEVVRAFAAETAAADATGSAPDPGASPALVASSGEDAAGHASDDSESDGSSAPTGLGVATRADDLARASDAPAGLGAAARADDLAPASDAQTGQGAGTEASDLAAPDAAIPATESLPAPTDSVTPHRTLAEALVAAALARGGRDNISVVVLESRTVGREGVEAPAPTE